MSRIAQRITDNRLLALRAVMHFFFEIEQISDLQLHSLAKYSESIQYSKTSKSNVFQISLTIKSQYWANVSLSVCFYDLPFIVLYTARIQSDTFLQLTERSFESVLTYMLVMFIFGSSCRHRV